MMFPVAHIAVVRSSNCSFDFESIDSSNCSFKFMSIEAQALRMQTPIQPSLEESFHNFSSIAILFSTTTQSESFSCAATTHQTLTDSVQVSVGSWDCVASHPVGLL